MTDANLVLGRIDPEALLDGRLRLDPERAYEALESLGSRIGLDAVSTAEAVIWLAIYTLIGASTVAVPIIATVISPSKTEPRLIAGREWLTRNGELLTGIILLIIGVVVIVIGVGRL